MHVVLLSRFFEYTTQWAPGQLESEYDKRLWITIEAPSEVRTIYGKQIFKTHSHADVFLQVIFADEGTCPLWSRMASSLAI